MINRTVSVRGLNVHVKVWNEVATRSLVMLHGFTGSTATWEETVMHLPKNVKIIAVDLTGHGRTDAPPDPERYEMGEQIADLDQLFNVLGVDRFSLLGYSMGGRVALSYALSFPEKVEQLILESSSPGLENEEDRQQRTEADKALAERIEREGIEAFVDYWGRIPLFETQKALSPNKQQAIRRERLSQNPMGLANSLRGIGTGKQPSNWGSLGKLQLPVLLITGELDSKFCTIAEEMKRRLPSTVVITVEKAGHAIHVEKPEQFATIITEHLKDNN